MDLSPRTASTFSTLRRNSRLYDALLRTEDGSEFKVHRIILAAAYPQFRSLFIADTSTDDSEKLYDEDWREYFLTEMTSDTLALLIDHAYGVPLQERVGTHNMSAALAVAEKYKVASIRQYCLRFLKANITCYNCVGTLHLAERNGYPDLHQEAFNFIVRNFDEVWTKCYDYCLLSVDDLSHVIQSDELHVSDEVAGTFRAVTHWVEADIDHRLLHLANLLLHVRFGLSRRRCFEEVYSHPLVFGNKNCEHILASLTQVKDQLELWGGEMRAVNPDHPWLRPRVPRDVLFVIGGWSNGSAINLMETYDCRADRWLIFSESRDAKPRAYHGVAVLDDCIYVVGGFDGTECFRSVLCLEPANQQWRLRSCMHHARCYVSVAVLDGVLYAMGGYDGERRTASSERFDPSQNQWTMVSDMHEARSDACAAAAMGRVYMCGGFSCSSNFT